MSTISTAYPYLRATPTRRLKTARIEPGDQLLTQPARTVFRDGVARQHTGAVQTKTGALVRTVDRIETTFHTGSGFSGRQQRAYTIHFTDGTLSFGHAPIFTWHAIDEAAIERKAEQKLARQGRL